MDSDWPDDELWPDMARACTDFRLDPVMKSPDMSHAGCFP
jgi:hypothetical protein